MKTLLETIFAMLFFALIIANLPTIMGFISLCIIIYFIFSAVNSIFVDSAEQTTVNQNKESDKGWEQTKHNTNKSESDTIKNPNGYSNYNYPRYRQPNYDHYDDHYDDWRDDDIPPDDEIHFNGTGAPFL